MEGGSEGLPFYFSRSRVGRWRSRTFRRCKQIPAGHEEGGNDRADHKAAQAEQGHAAQGGDQHDIVGHFGVLADQNRAQHVVHQTDDKNAEEREHSALPNGPVAKK